MWLTQAGDSEPSARWPWLLGVTWNNFSWLHLISTLTPESEKVDLEPGKELVRDAGVGTKAVTPQNVPVMASCRRRVGKLSQSQG